jgi:predicted RNase H-like HicB family nuclease
MAARTFTAVLHKEENLYVAECPEVGTVSQGYTIEEAIASIKEATELYLEEFPTASESSGERAYYLRHTQH